MGIKFKRKLLKTPKRRTRGFTIPTSWYRKDRVTMNGKLRQEIIDSLPFDIDVKKADVILWTMFDYIVDKVIETGRLSIPALGVFSILYRAPKKFSNVCVGGRKQLRTVVKNKPGKHYLHFRPCIGIRRGLNPKQEEEG